MKKIGVLVLTIIISFVFMMGCKKGDTGADAGKADKPSYENFNKELSGEWTQRAGGSTFVYKFSVDKFSYTIGKMNMTFDIAKIEDAQRMIVISTNKNFIPCWWTVVDPKSIKITPLVGIKNSTTIEAALKVPKPKKIHLLKKKV